MRWNKRTAAICNTTAAICFGIVSYGHYYRGRIALGCVFTILTLAQFVLALRNLRNMLENNGEATKTDL